MERSSGSVSGRIVERVGRLHLLKHPFYEAWSAGKLSREALSFYARQYYHHVAAFPRYVSAIHSNCSDLPARQVLLDNLRDEEQGSENHPELWLRFAEALGSSREATKGEGLLPQTRSLIDTYFELARKEDFTEGLAALFAYEWQVPEVAQSKIDGLRKFYGIDGEQALKFFQVHLSADVYHSKACAELLDAHVQSHQSEERAIASAERAAQALWGFLDGVQRAAC